MQIQGASHVGENSTTNDNLKDVENDLITRLNTREYKYFGYYTRIKNQLNQWWVPQVQQKFTKMMKQGRTIASENSKVTKLVIVLNNKGNLVKVQVMAASGVRDLDDAAIEAFRQAAPFPNPPKGMIESDGTVKIRWDCVVES
jgi:protein TonB